MTYFIDNKKYLLGIIFLINIWCVKISAFRIEIHVEPEIPTILTGATLKVQASYTAVAVTGIKQWTWKINREPNDFEDYVDDPSKVEIQTSYQRDVKIPVNRTKAGIYRVYITAISITNETESIVYFVPIIESDGILSSIRMDDYDIDSIMEFQLGSKVLFYDCARLEATPNEKSRYDGIYKVQWDVGLEHEHVFNTTWEMADTKYKKYYSEGGHPVCVYMANPGEYTIKFNVWGGKFEYLLGQRRNPLKAVTNYYNSQAVKKVKVVDCSKILYLNEISDYKQEETYKEIYLDLVINNGRQYDFRSYSLIKLENGFHVKEGSSFSAKIIPTPPLIYCDCKGAASSSLTKSVNKMVDYNDCCTVNLDLTTKILNIRIDNPIKYLEIWSLNGQKVKSFVEDFNNIDLSDLLSGYYILKIFNENGFLSKKILIK